MKQKIFVLLVLLMVSRLGHAEKPVWFLETIKVDNPNQLAYWTVIAGDCPVTEKEMQEIIEGVFVRSRVKPLKEAIYKPGSIYLDVNLTCFKRSEDRFIYNMQIYFSRQFPRPSVKFGDDFGALGSGGKTYITATLKNKIEGAVTVFIKANFDL